MWIVIKIALSLNILENVDEHLSFAMLYLGWGWEDGQGDSTIYM